MTCARKTKDALEELHDHHIDKQQRIIYVHSDFHFEEQTGVDFRMASRFIKNLDYLNSISTEPITVKLLTCGGDWNEGMAMYDAIANSKCHITTFSYAHARSMSSIIIQAADHRQISKHADFMVHYGTYSDEGDAREVKSAMDHYSKTNDVMLNIYAEKCISGKYATESGKKVSDLKKFIKAQIDKKTAWWMTAEEALYYGFVDEII